MDELCATLLQDGRVKPVHISSVCTVFAVNAGCINDCKFRLSLGDSRAPSTLTKHCKKCWEVFVDIFPPTRSYLQRRACMNKIGRSAEPYTPYCIMCYRYTHITMVGDGYCSMCTSRHTMETNALTYKWFLCRETGACVDVTRIIIGQVITFEVARK